ncbi:DUF5808 domain-containing protein [Paraferrimonas sp. SM1919]|uniref:DUF5808 domain-containing protein n=1 Tax=Paraferrimonas sp. SM1919 TaxID=2662263 RepID=UPI00210F9380|nr:DUF5808 domain-containing protein [Paraferrimonas sp. SM1919]
MEQAEINQCEWGNPENWSGPKWLGVYFSKKDSRIWVPKPVAYTGWTLNLAHSSGVACLFTMFGLALLAAVAAGRYF